MPLLGNTKTYGLTNVLKFLSDSQYSGHLRIYFKSQRVDFFLVKGNLRIPLTGDWSPIFTQETLKTNTPPQGEEPPHLKQDVENQVYNIFFWEQATYVFERDSLPKEISEERGLKYVELHTGSLVMEASRRMDDLKRAAEKVPPKNALFCLAQDSPPLDSPVLPYINGSRDIQEIVDSAGKGLYDVATLISKLLGEGKATLLPPEQYVDRLKQFVAQRDCVSAFYLYKHILNNLEQGSDSPQILFESIDSTTNLEDFTSEMTGFQALCFLRDLMSNQISIALEVQGREKYIFLLDHGKIYFQRGSQYIPQTIEKLVSRDLIPENVSSDLKKVTLLEGEMFSWILHRHLSAQNLFHALLIEDLAELSREETLQVTAKKPSLQKAREDFLLLQSDGTTLEIVLGLLQDWEEIQKDAPGEKSIVVLVRPAREKYVETNFPILGDFLRHFHRNRLNLRELREKIGLSTNLFEFYSRVRFHLEQGDLRFLEVAELKKLITAEIMIEDYANAIRLIEAGSVRHKNDPFFREKLEEIRLCSEGVGGTEDDRLVGDLTTFSLAEVLQNLVTNQLTGTLRILIAGESQAQKEIYFDQGDIFLMREEEETSASTVSTFLDTEALAGLASMAEEQNRDEYLSELAEVAREEIYELFLWEGATFNFILDALPPQFYHPHKNTIKLSLEADIFLMEAIGRLDMWMEISQVISTGKNIFEFTSPEGKLQALAMGKNPQIVYMIDGVKNVEDLIRVSNMGRLETCSFLYELYQMNLSRPLKLAELILRGQESYRRKEYAMALKYYECAIRLKPKDERIQKIVAGLRKLVNQ